MALVRTTYGNLTAATGTRGTANLASLLSGWTIAETAGAAAIVNLRDSVAVPTAPTAATGAVGNTTIGLHMWAYTWVTRAGEGAIGALVENTSPGTTITTLTLPVYSRSGQGPLGTWPSPVIGRNIYATKAGAPATGVTPTSIQWFLVTATPSTTIAAGSTNLPLPQATINVASTASFLTPTTNGKILVTTSQGVQVVSFAAMTGTSFTGCTGGAGIMTTGGAVTAANLMDNTTTTYSANVADGSFTATNAPLVDKSGEVLAKINLAALQQATDNTGPDVPTLEGNGGIYVEAQSGTVTFAVRGL